MSARDTVLQIVPHLPGTFDGVGDYALNLAHAFSAGRGLDTTFLVAGETKATSKDGYAVLSGLNSVGSRELAERHEHVILHYVNYGYQTRGIPFSLRTFAKRLRKSLRGRWVTTFHELYASGPPWKSAFWLRPLQVGIARDLIDASDSCIVSNAPIEHAIHAYDPRKKVLTAPVMSNFGEPDPADLPPASPRRWAICGGTALIARSLHRFEQLRPRIPTAFAPDHLDIVGGREDPSITGTVNRLKRELSVHHNPEVSVDLASELLRQSAFGWLDYFGAGKVWPNMVLKSTAFAAFCAHGVVPILSHQEGQIAIGGDALPGPFFLTKDRVLFPQAEELLPIRRRLADWYRAHASAGQLARIYVEALR